MAERPLKTFMNIFNPQILEVNGHSFENTPYSKVSRLQMVSDYSSSSIDESFSKLHRYFTHSIIAT